MGMNEWGLGSVLDLPDAPGPARDAAILQHVQAGDAVVAWTKLIVSPRLTILVMTDALKLGGVRVGAGAALAQQVADVLGAMFLTPKVLDLVFAARSVTVQPMLQYDANQMLTTHWFVKESQRIDAAVGTADGIIQTVGKPWMMTNLLLAHPGRAVNYGWHLPAGTTSPWEGVTVYPSVTGNAMVIQQPGWAHGLDEADYSEMMLFMGQQCWIDGEPSTMARVLTDPELAPLVSHEGVIKVPGLRQPGVPQLSPNGSSSPGAGSAMAAFLALGAGVLLLL